jgi:hypothetical protein
MKTTRNGNKLQTCFYCETTFSTSRTAVGDHFPVPERNGGTRTVPCCVTCHNAKDNLSVLDWNGDMMASVIADFPKLSAHTRIFLARILAVMTDLQNEYPDRLDSTP